MKKYYKFYPRNYANEYTVLYTENAEDEKEVKKLLKKAEKDPNCDFYQVTRQQALDTAARDKKYIYPAGAQAGDIRVYGKEVETYSGDKYNLNGRIIERKGDKNLKKQDYEKQHGLKKRTPTREERANATKNGSTAKYVIETPSGHKYWSQNGTMEDLRAANRASNAEIAKARQKLANQAAKKPAQSTAKKPAQTAKKATATTTKKPAKSAAKKTTQAAKKTAKRK